MSVLDKQFISTRRFVTKGEFISGIESHHKRFRIKDARTVTNLALPLQTLNSELLKKKFEYLQEVPFAEYGSAIPRILIGVDQSKLGVTSETKEGGWMEPIAAKTRLGWVIYGKVSANSNEQQEHLSFHICECSRKNEELSKTVKEFMTAESFGVKVPDKERESDDIERARKIFEATTRKVGSRFETGLLWRLDSFSLPPNKKMALSRLNCLEKRLGRDDQRRVAYCERIEEYVRKGYARKLEPEECMIESERKWFLPHFDVYNPHKPDKMRIVFDAAAEERGVSLNSMLLVGPEMLVPLPKVLGRLREQKIGISGDIAEMFSRILIRPEDRVSQRFLWRGCNTDITPEEYEMCVMTFGAKCSPSSAQMVKNLNAKEHEIEFPEAAKAIIENHYVDDYLDSMNTEEEVIERVKQITEIHKRGGFEIRNWISNSDKVCKAISKQGGDKEIIKNLQVDEEQTEKVLGMFWDTKSDEFFFKINRNKIEGDVLCGTKRPTKREVARVLASIFDPFDPMFPVFYRICCFMLKLS